MLTGLAVHAEQLLSSVVASHIARCTLRPGLCCSARIPGRRSSAIVIWSFASKRGRRNHAGIGGVASAVVCALRCTIVLMSCRSSRCSSSSRGPVRHGPRLRRHSRPVGSSSTSDPTGTRHHACAMLPAACSGCHICMLADAICLLSISLN